MTITKATIMIPTYRQARFLPGAIESALAQDYPNLEIVVADDASPDETEEVAAHYGSDPRLRYVRNRQNLGRVGNYRHALEALATGDVVLNLDGDDWLIEPTFVSSAMALYARNPDLSLVFGRAHDYSERLQRFVPTDVNRGLPAVNDGLELLLRYADGSVAIPHAAALYKRDLALQAGFYQYDVLATDSISLLSLLPRHRVGFIDKPVAAWRLHDSNATWSGSAADRLAGDRLRVEVPAASIRADGSLGEARIRRWQREMLALSGQEYLADCLVTHRYKVAASFVRQSVTSHPRSSATMLLGLLSKASSRLLICGAARTSSPAERRVTP